MNKKITWIIGVLALVLLIGGASILYHRMSAEAAPVTVHCAVGVRCPPYSSGYLNCFSAEQKCDEVEDTAFLKIPQLTPIAALIIASTDVEQAPYTPLKGML